MNTKIPGYTLFGLRQGAGYIIDDPDIINDYITQTPVSIVGTIIIPNTGTDLLGHFCRPLFYLGLHGKNEMIFYIGSDSDMFRERHFYQSVHLIDDNRIFEMFGPGSGRDFIYVNGKWK